MNKLVALFAVLALSSAYANQDAARGQTGQDSEAARVQNHDQMQTGVIKQKKATTEEEKSQQQKAEEAKKLQEQNRGQ